MIGRSQVLSWWNQVSLTHPQDAEEQAQVAMHYASRYQSFLNELGPQAPPWWFVAGLHMRESDFNFDTYLGNGDPLRNHNGKQIRTIHVPAGRGPFFSWESGARDAIIYDHLDQLKPPTDHWDIVTCLMRSEEFNGLGYRSQGRRSPYVWSFTNIYQGGKYIADHKYSAAAWDHQCGVAAMWLALKLNHGIDLNEV